MNESAATSKQGLNILLIRAVQGNCGSLHEPDPSLMNKGWRWWMLIVLIGVFSLGFRYYYLTHAQVMQPFDDQAHARADGVQYYAYARNLVRHGVFSLAPEGTMPLVGDSYRDPGYPVFLAVWMKIFPQWDQWYPAVLLSQGILASLSAVFALCLSRRWMPFWWLAVAGIIMAIWPHSVSIGSFIMSESLSGFLCLLGLLLLSKALDRQSISWATASGIGFALGALTNAVLLPFAPLLGLYFAYRRYISLGMLAGLMAGAIILPAAWMTRNALLPPSPNSSATRALGNLVIGSWPHFYKDLQASLKDDPQGIAAIKLVSNEIDLISSSPKAGFVHLAKRMSADPMEYAHWYFISKPVLLWDWGIRIGAGDIYIYPTRNSPFKDNAIYRTIIAICHTINYPIFILMILGGLVAILPRHRITPSLTAAVLLLICVSATYIILQAEPRYSIAYRPMEILLAIFAIYRVNEWIASRNKKSPIIKDKISIPR
jgi:hypothetical protein